jgi:hypothetical protein
VGLLDRYIARAYWVGILPVVLLLGGLFSFLGLAEQLEDVGKGDFTTGAAIRVVLLMMPRQIVGILPVVALRLATFVIALGPVALRPVAAGTVAFGPVALRTVSLWAVSPCTITARRTGFALLPLGAGGAFGALPGLRCPGEGVEGLHLRRGFGFRFRDRGRGAEFDKFPSVGRFAAENREGAAFAGQRHSA